MSMGRADPMPRVIVLEGLNGVGKSSLAKAMSSFYSIPILRAFRHSRTDLHLSAGDNGIAQRMKQLGVPANTFVDDVYLADFLQATRISCVMDRSMGSAIAHGLLDGSVKNPAHALQLVDHWESQLSGLDVVYVYMVADEALCRERCAGRWQPNRGMWSHLNESFERVYDRIRLRKRRLDTSTIASSAYAFQQLIHML